MKGSTLHVSDSVGLKLGPGCRDCRGFLFVLRWASLLNISVLEAFVDGGV